jgi:hypothetical protein
MAIPNQNRAFPIKRRKTEDTLVSWDSVTTADGNAGGISLIDSGLIGSNDFITDQVTVIILGGAANLERQLCTAFNPATGEVDFSPLSAQIVAGTPYRLTGLMSPEVSVAGLAADLAVPLPNSVNNVLMRDVVGNKTDNPVSTVGATASLMAYMKAIINGAGGTGKIYLGITVAAAGSLTINNDVLCVGNITVGAGGTLVINGDVDLTGYVTNAGAVTITGKLNVNGDSSASSGYLDNTGGTQFTVGGDAYVAGSITNTTGKIYFEGNLKQGYGNFNNALGGVVIVDGDFVSSDVAITNAGILDINGNCLNASRNSALNVTTGSLSVEGDCTAAAGMSLGAGGNITINGNVETAYIENTAAEPIIILGDCQIAHYVVNSGGGTITIYGKLDINGDSSGGDGYLDNTGGLQITVCGDAYISGAITNTTGKIYFEGSLKVGFGDFSNGSGLVIIDGDLTVSAGKISTTSGPLDINGDCSARDGITTATGDIYIEGNCNILGNIESSGSGDISINGNCNVSNAQIVNNSTGTVSIGGKCTIANGEVNINGGSFIVYGDFLLNGTSGAIIVSAGVAELYGADNFLSNQFIQIALGATVNIYGDFTTNDSPCINNAGTLNILGVARLYGSITNTGTLTYHGVYPETAVNISAVSTGSTDVLNLALTSGYHYTINKLRLKCADPGADTVTVTLQELINGVLTVVDSFIIIGSLGVNPNYQNYFSLMDMFGLPELFGDQLEVSVESSAGTYAVTGSYSYRSE